MARVGRVGRVGRVDTALRHSPSTQTADAARQSRRTSPPLFASKRINLGARREPGGKSKFEAIAPRPSLAVLTNRQIEFESGNSDSPTVALHD